MKNSGSFMFGNLLMPLFNKKTAGSKDKKISIDTQSSDPGKKIAYWTKSNIKSCVLLQAEDVSTRDSVYSSCNSSEKLASPVVSSSPLLSLPPPPPPPPLPPVLPSHGNYQ
jgi:hypothetical protein